MKTMKKPPAARSPAAAAITNRKKRTMLSSTASAPTIFFIFRRNQKKRILGRIGAILAPKTAPSRAQDSAINRKYDLARGGCKRGRKSQTFGVMPTVYVVAIPLFQCVFVLRLDEAAADLDCIEFVAAHPAIDDLLLPSFGVKGPPASDLHDRRGKWPILLAHGENSTFLVLWVHADSILFSCLFGEVLGEFAIVPRLASQNDLASVHAEELLEASDVKIRGGIDEGGGCVLGRCESLYSGIGAPRRALSTEG